MTQNGIITRVLNDQMAEVVVQRGTACGGNCGGNCGSCEACAYDARIVVNAFNTINAAAGDRIIITSKTSRILGAAFLIYMLPLAFFFVAYAIAYGFGLSQGLCILVSFLGLVLGALGVVVLGRRSGEVRYEITSYQR